MLHVNILDMGSPLSGFAYCMSLAHITAQTFYLKVIFVCNIFIICVSMGFVRCDAHLVATRMMKKTKYAYCT